MFGGGERRRRHTDFRDDLLRGLDAKTRDLREALDGVMMRRQEVGHVLIELAQMRLQQPQFVQGKREEPPIHGMQRGAGLERISQLIRRRP
jgi:hypothetical protein